MITLVCQSDRLQGTNGWGCTEKTGQLFLTAIQVTALVVGLFLISPLGSQLDIVGRITPLAVAGVITLYDLLTTFYYCATPQEADDALVVSIDRIATPKSPVASVSTPSSLKQVVDQIELRHHDGGWHLYLGAIAESFSNGRSVEFPILAHEEWSRIANTEIPRYGFKVLFNASFSGKPTLEMVAFARGDMPGRTREPEVDTTWRMDEALVASGCLDKILTGTLMHVSD